MKKHIRAFTLIELVIVIAILGILTSIALPRFINASAAARKATVLAAAGSIKSAVALSKAYVVANDIPIDSTLRQIDMGDGVSIDIINGVPACSSNGIPIASGTQEYTWYIGGSNLCTVYPNLGRDSGGSTIYNGTCAVVYDHNTGGMWSPVTSGC